MVAWFGGIGGRLADGARGMWDWIGDTFRSALNAIIRMWNNFSLTIDIPDAIPGLPDKWTINTPNIPLVADGGFVTRPTLAVVGEAGPEAVVPLPRLGKFANRHTGGAGSTDQPTFSPSDIKLEVTIGADDRTKARWFIDGRELAANLA